MTEQVSASPEKLPAAGSEAMPSSSGERSGPRLRVLDYALLLKPRVMSLVVFTAAAGLFLAPGRIEAWVGAVAVLCISLGAGGAAAINMWYDRDIDLLMKRTMRRPIPSGRLSPKAALVFGLVLSAASVAAMALVVNATAAGLLAFTIFFYVFVYTVWLKRRTPRTSSSAAPRGRSRR